jgi:flagellar hook-basal body complex protein FliE
MSAIVTSLAGGKILEQKNLTPNNIAPPSLGIKELEVTPFQLVFDKAVESLQAISDIEFRANNLIEEYIQGEGSVDEVMIATTELNLAITAATTIINNGVQAFKEIQNMAI